MTQLPPHTLHAHDGRNAADALEEPMTELTPRPHAGLYRVVWRWHFYAGLLVAPVLFVVAVTGAIYVFKDELERVIYPDTMFVAPQTETVSLDHQVSAVEVAYPGSVADTVEVEDDPTRATSVRVRSGSVGGQRVYVNQYTGEVQGALGEDSVFRVVLDIHRRLLIGTTGRVVVEVVTCWAIVLLVTGLYLWFPRRVTLWGVLVPRLRAHPYTVLRDCHAITGAFLMPVGITIALTGLVYSLVWGSGYTYASATGGTSPTAAFKSVSQPDAPPLSLDRAVAITRAHYPEASFIDVRLPTNPDYAIVARAKLSESTAPRSQIVLALDRSTGEVLNVQSSGQYPALRWWRTTWNYPLHVGSVLGTPTKVIWLVACLVLAALPATGLWMWWKRRPDGRTGLPRRPERRVPWWLLGVIGLLGVFLPAVGASVVLIMGGEWVANRVRRRPVTLTVSM
ncbi:MAG: PepSY domain-containing protein [Planctomycetes bacterium]|nr:PepSY domain-containing protein [Planctomycetota bacterium]